jgi:hypothetical protein
MQNKIEAQLEVQLNQNSKSSEWLPVVPARYLQFLHRPSHLLTFNPYHVPLSMPFIRLRGQARCSLLGAKARRPWRSDAASAAAVIPLRTFYNRG